MPIFVRYLDRRNPPAPFVNVVLRNPYLDRSAAYPAQLDTGADRTVVPGPIAEALELAEDGVAGFVGFMGGEITLPLCRVAVKIGDTPEAQIRAVIGLTEPHILLGRDVLNQLRVVLDGPNLTLEIA